MEPSRGLEFSGRPHKISLSEQRMQCSEWTSTMMVLHSRMCSSFSVPLATRSGAVALLVLHERTASFTLQAVTTSWTTNVTYTKKHSHDIIVRTAVSDGLLRTAVCVVSSSHSVIQCVSKAQYYTPIFLK